MKKTVLHHFFAILSLVLLIQPVFETQLPETGKTLPRRKTWIRDRPGKKWKQKYQNRIIHIVFKFLVISFSACQFSALELVCLWA